MKKTKVLSIAVLALLVFVSASLAASGAEIEVPADYGSIQAAVDAANPGDVILLAEGVYQESVTIAMDNITIKAIGDPANTVIQGTITLESVVGARFEGLTVTGPGDGIRVRGNCQGGVPALEVVNCSLSGNTGSGIDFSHGAVYDGVVIENSQINQNGADGINLSSVGSDVVIEGSEISNNGAITATGIGIRLGGGVTDVVIEENEITGNAFANIHPQSG
ncbi:MAG: right-handed parallel beta-helix repeat-containing protein [Candidatus Acetothermia bacterium]